MTYREGLQSLDHGADKDTTESEKISTSAAKETQEVLEKPTIIEYIELVTNKNPEAIETLEKEAENWGYNSIKDYIESTGGIKIMYFSLRQKNVMHNNRELESRKPLILYGLNHRGKIVEYSEINNKNKQSNFEDSIFLGYGIYRNNEV